MQITADSIGVYTKVFSLSPYQNFDVIRQWSVQWCLMYGPSCLQGSSSCVTCIIINIFAYFANVAYVVINISTDGTNMLTHGHSVIKITLRLRTVCYGSVMDIKC